MKDRNQLLTIVIFSIIITSIHYTDNAIFINRYPEPEWITASGVYLSWGVMSLLGIAGYWLYSQEKHWWSYFCLAVYSLTGLSSPAHYFYGGMSEFSLKMNLFIWFDFVAGASVIGFVLADLFDRVARNSSNL